MSISKLSYGTICLVFIITRQQVTSCELQSDTPIQREVYSKRGIRMKDWKQENNELFSGHICAAF